MFVKITGTILHKVLEPVATKYNERHFRTVFNNLKTYVEERVATNCGIHLH